MARPAATHSVTAILADGTEVPWLELDARSVVEKGMAREIPQYVGQTNTPLRYWCVTTQSHIWCESKLERQRLVLADFDRDVYAMTSQPMWLKGTFRGKSIRHVPDFILLSAFGVTIVNVKPLQFLQKERVVRVFDWVNRLVEHREGWTHEVWSGADEPFIYQMNIKTLAGSKNALWFDRNTLARIDDAAPGLSIESVMAQLAPEIDRLEVKRAIQHCLWRQSLSADLTQRLSKNTILQLGPAHG